MVGLRDAVQKIVACDLVGDQRGMFGRYEKKTTRYVLGVSGVRSGYKRKYHRSCTMDFSFGRICLKI